MTDRQRMYLDLATLVASLVAVVLSVIVATAARAEWPDDAPYSATVSLMNSGSQPTLAAHQHP